MLGSPEGELALYQATVYLATVPKSNPLILQQRTQQQRNNETTRSKRSKDFAKTALLQCVVTKIALAVFTLPARYNCTPQ
ncbi:MAG: hypothetical protein D3916_15995 [Candidatus Electrothrix sp. MAN1_4]|nr:hypothetical protein [Candidatus Electrothrix sp. MAN1_4]